MSQKPVRTFCLCLAAVLCAQATLAAAAEEAFVTGLTEENIVGFLQDMRHRSMGENGDFGPDETIAWLERHMNPGGRFVSNLRYEIPGYPTQDTEMTLGRDDFIAGVVEGRSVIRDYSTLIKIEEMKISGSGQSATVRTTGTEKGLMPWPNEKGEQEYVPVEGHSDCQQKIAVSLNNYIQLSEADCKTVITFLPFGGKPLEE